MIVYKTTNILNGKFYIGQDSNNNPRYLGSGSLLKKAIKKYGKQNFVKEIIEECSSLEQLNEREKYWIRELKAQELGYNISDGGFKNDFVWNEKQKQAHSDFMKYEFNSYSEAWINQQTKDKHGENGPYFGKKHSIDSKKKMSESHKKNPTKYWLGKTQSQESNEKRRKKSLEFRHSEEHKNSITGAGNPFYGKQHSDESKKKMSESKKKKTPEQKLETYVKFYISRTGNEPSETQKLLKLEEYKNGS